MKTNKLHQLGVYLVCGECGRWTRAPLDSKWVQCKVCGSWEKIPRGVFNRRAPESFIDEKIKQFNLQRKDGRSLYFCPRCREKYDFPNLRNGDFIKCRKCGLAFVVKGGEENAEPASEIKTPTIKSGVLTDHELICAYDYQPIEDDDEWLECPECGLPYHRECWEENFGCAEFGCKMAGALKPNEEPDQISNQNNTFGLPVQTPAVSNSLPWSYLLLGFSVFGALLSLFLFGLPCLITGGATVVFLVMGKEQGGAGPAALALLISVVGFFMGVITTVGLYAG